MQTLKRPEWLAPLGVVILLLATTGVVLATGSARQAGQTAAVQQRDHAHDFDFLYGGTWLIQNQRLARRLQGSHEWISFDATDECHPLAGGIGDYDTYRTEYWPHFVGVTLRLYDPKTRQWSLYWTDNRNAPGVLQPPVVGHFEGDTGLFYGPDTYDGVPITVRYTWKVLGHDTARWEQAFSTDGGKTWETNWVMQMSRMYQQPDTAMNMPKI